MPVYRILYHSPFHPIENFLPHEIELVAPKGWDIDEIVDAYSNQHPAHKIISCTQIEK